MLDTLTLGDLADIEDVTGDTINGVDLANPPMKFALALYWVFRRKEEPKYTYEDARKTPITQLDRFKAVLQGSENPTESPPGLPVAGGGVEAA